MTTTSDLEAFLAGQQKLLNVERNAEIERTSLLLSACSPKLLETRGLALGGLGVVGINIGLGGKSLIEFERPSAYHTSPLFPPHTFRPGDLARIEEHVSSNANSKRLNHKSGKKPDSNGSHSVEGVVFKVADSRIIIAVDSSDNDLDLPERCRILKLANSITFDRMDRAIEHLTRLVLPSTTSDTNASKDLASTTTLNPLIQVLLGMTTPSPKITLADIQFFDPSLNDSQKDAVQFALESPELALIHGPPGTGKTHTLIEIIRHFVADGKRVLVCGASNLAVDNLLERLIPHSIPVTRLGHPARILSSLHLATLDAQAARSDESALAKDVKEELEGAMSTLAGRGKSRIKGPERKKMWEDVRELKKEYRKRESQVIKSVMAQARVVLATCHSSGGRQLNNMQFDIVIIDEATQALEAVCWVPILKAKKLILAGDPLQLPPTIMSAAHSKDLKKQPQKGTKSAKQASASVTEKMNSKTSSKSKLSVPLQPDAGPSKESRSQNSTTEGNGRLRVSSSLETTLFDRLERMYGPNIKRMLAVQYRMHAQIAEFPSTMLYSSALISDPSVASHLLKDLPNVISSASFETIADVLDVPIVFFDTDGCEYYERLEGESTGVPSGDEGSRCNENEAVLVKAWVEKLVGGGVLPSQIAVITPYQAQVALLTRMLKPTMPDLEIGSVDGMQGREKEAVVLSLVRSNEQHEVGFLKEKRRLNVAMTRPRRHLCVIGDSSTVSQGSDYLKEWMEWLEANADVRFGEIE